MPGSRLVSSQRFRKWLSEPLGKSLLSVETQRISALINKLFGYHLILLGEPQFLEIVKDSPILHRVWVHPEIDPSFEGSNVCARQDKLPLVSDESDLVVLAHCLEAHPNSHEALREAYRVLIPEGHVIITGFNPWSIWGLWRLVSRYIKRRPWDGRFISISRLRDWLALLGFDLVTINMGLFYPPISNAKFLQRMRWLEWVGRWFWPFWGGCYIILAQKRVVTLTPIRPVWERQRKLVPAGFVEPAARVE